MVESLTLGYTLLKTDDNRRVVVFQFEGTGFSDFFEQFFGGRADRSRGASPFAHHGTADGPDEREAALRGQDIQGDILITLDEVSKGAMRAITVRRTNAHTGQEETETYAHHPDWQPLEQVGVRIGEQSVSADFDGLLPWGHLDNRPFLRCLHGFGLCRWRLERFEEAGRIFERMLWLNPTDNQGARCLVDGVRAKKVWEDEREPR